MKSRASNYRFVAERPCTVLIGGDPSPPPSLFFLSIPPLPVCRFAPVRPHEDGNQSPRMNTWRYTLVKMALRNSVPLTPRSVKSDNVKLIHLFFSSPLFATLVKNKPLWPFWPSKYIQSTNHPQVGLWLFQRLNSQDTRVLQTFCSIRYTAYKHMGMIYYFNQVCVSWYIVLSFV